MFPFTSSCPDPDTATCEAAPPSLPLPIASIPFLVTAIAIATLASRHLFPLLGSPLPLGDSLPTTAPASWRPCTPSAPMHHARIPRVAFASLLALAGTLGQVILFDMAGLLGQQTRDGVLGFVVPALLALLVVGVPALEINDFVGGEIRRGKRTGSTEMLLVGLLAAWGFVFWSVGIVAPAPVYSPADIQGGLLGQLNRACLTRIGIIGIALMALLSGFASVSTPWALLISPLLTRGRAFSETDIQRRQARLESTSNMLIERRLRLQALERKASASFFNTHGAMRVSPGIMGEMMGTIRSATSGDELERRALRIEIAALETVEANLLDKLATLKAKYEERVRAATPLGRTLALPTHIFAMYCLYRVAVTALSTLRRVPIPLVASPTSPSTFSSTDPVSRLLGLLTHHWDPTLDQLAWARQISFLMSGMMLFASLSSAMQTIRLFSRVLPATLLLKRARANAALMAAQVAATYVISASLLLRGSLPRDLLADGAVGGILRGVLEPGWVERWFEGWFLVAGCITALGIWVGRMLEGPGGPEGGVDEEEEEKIS